MCRNCRGIFLEMNWYLYSHFYTIQIRSSLNQTEKQEITKQQEKEAFLPDANLITSCNPEWTQVTEEVER